MWRGHWLCIRIYFLVLSFSTVQFVLKIRITYHIIHFDWELENRIVRKKYMYEKSRQIDDSLWKLMENENVKKNYHTTESSGFLFALFFIIYFSLHKLFYIVFSNSTPRRRSLGNVLRVEVFHPEKICCFYFFTFSNTKLMFE